MTISYDCEVDALLVRFIEGTVTTQHVAEGVAVAWRRDEHSEILSAFLKVVRETVLQALH